ncbi:YlbE-like family protein [Ornithinibacillus halotolerans]|nr:YlbE-like family protein [Ornithinibacillus halotolerans]
MDKELYNYLKAKPELLNFIRHNPKWYRYLSRNPNQIQKLEKEAKLFYGQTITQKIEKVNQNVQMVGMLLQFADMMKD